MLDNEVCFLSTVDQNCILDLCFVVDTSGSVKRQWHHLLKFVVDVTKKINVGPEGNHIGVVVFGELPRKIFDFNEFDNKTYNETEMFDKITSIRFEGYRTFINRGFLCANLQVFRHQYGMRPDAKQV